MRLREVGHELFSELGVDNTTIQQITDAADIGFGTFYNYYPTKEALAEDVLDCLIHSIGRTNDLITERLEEHDPVRIVANSVRTVIRTMVTNPVYAWWVQRFDVLVDRMRIGFAPFGLRDIDQAVAAGEYRLIADDRLLAWSHLIWLTAAAARDILSGEHPASTEQRATEAVLRVMGVDHAMAAAAVSTTLPDDINVVIDFSHDV